MKKEYKDFISLIRSIFDENYDFDISKIDLRVMFNMAKSHSMSNLIYYAFKDKNISSNIKEFIYKQHMASLYRQALISNEGKCVFKSLSNNNMEVMPLKGWYVKEYYPSEDMRPMSDIDVLFYIKDIENIENIMKNMGYNLRKGDENHYIFEKPPFIMFEFHPCIFHDNDIMSSHMNPGWQYAKKDIDNPIKRMTDEGLYIYQMAHLAKHFFEGGTGVRSVLDIWIIRQVIGKKLDFDYINNEFEKAGILEFSKNIEQLSDIWFSGHESTEYFDELGTYIVESGTFGTAENAVLNSVIKNNNNDKKVIFFIKKIFYPYSQMKHRYTVLKYLPFLLPIFWIINIFRVLLNRTEKLKLYVKAVKNTETSDIIKHKEKMRKFGLKI